jgi:hypothetical protein
MSLGFRAHYIQMLARERPRQQPAAAATHRSDAPAAALSAASSARSWSGTTSRRSSLMWSADISCAAAWSAMMLTGSHARQHREEGSQADRQAYT